MSLLGNHLPKETGHHSKIFTHPNKKSIKVTNTETINRNQTQETSIKVTYSVFDGPRVDESRKAQELAQGVHMVALAFVPPRPARITVCRSGEDDAGL